jgi:ABC-type glycerol-3-phosphate transport system substrate-binding protein
VHKGISAIVVVLVGLLGVAGCGGDSTISRTEYEQRIELACNKGLKEREELFKKLTVEYEKLSRAASQKEQAELQAGNVGRLVTIYQGTTEEIADIGFPKQGEKMAEELVKAREDGAEKLAAKPEAINEFTTIFTKATKTAENLGVASCGK